jgi:hypothetical protein
MTGKGSDHIYEDMGMRLARYEQRLTGTVQALHDQFFKSLAMGTIGVSAFFVLGLPLLNVDFYHVTFNFFCVVYEFLAAAYILKLAITQNKAVDTIIRVEKEANRIDASDASARK